MLRISAFRSRILSMLALAAFTLIIVPLEGLGNQGGPTGAMVER